MAAVLPMPSEMARKIEATILHKLASVGQAAVAERLQVSESKVSRFKGDDLRELAIMLDVLGLKVVPQHVRCYDEATLAAMLTLAKQRMEQIEQPQELAWE